MLSINTNLSSLVAQNSLKSSTIKLNQAIERMSTGFKINHAKDNAANYSIVTDMNMKISSYMVAEDNCLSGIDMLNTASENLELISDMLTRLRDLQEQACNGTYGEQSLQAINTEANALVDEIERIYNTAEYNGQKLLQSVDAVGYNMTLSNTTGDFINEVSHRDTTSMTTMADVNESNTISNGTYSISTTEDLIKLATMTNNGLITGGEFVLANNIDLSTAGNWTPIGNSVDKFFTGIFDGNGYIIKNLSIKNVPCCNATLEGYVAGLFGSAINATIKNLGVENICIENSGVQVGGIIASGNNVEINNCYTTGKISGVAEIIDLTDFHYGMFAIGGINSGYIDSTITNSYSLINISQPSDSALLGASVYISGLGGDKISNSFFAGKINSSGYDYNDITGQAKIGLPVGGANGPVYFTDDCISAEALEQIRQAIIDSGEDFENTVGYIKTKNELQQQFGINLGISDTGGLSGGSTHTILQIGINSDTTNQLEIVTSCKLEGLSSLRNIGNDTSSALLNQLDSLLAEISSKAVHYGASQNRLNSAIREISTKYENLVSSRSTLRDADIAEVSSEYIRQQILQQASATLLATVNQAPSIALQLI